MNLIQESDFATGNTLKRLNESINHKIKVRKKQGFRLANIPIVPTKILDDGTYYFCATLIFEKD